MRPAESRPSRLVIRTGRAVVPSSSWDVPFATEAAPPPSPLLAVPALLVGVVLAALIPATVSAHPLGNFTINHYAGLTIGRDAIRLDVVIDMAEIPTFQERQAMDADGDGSVGDDEADAWAATTCSTLAGDLAPGRRRARGRARPRQPRAAFPAGAGGLSTLRLECGYTAPLAGTARRAGGGRRSPTAPTRSGSAGARSSPRATASILDTHGLPATSPAKKLTAYPADLIAQPLDIRSATIDARPDPAASVEPSTTAVPSAVAPGPAGAGVVGSGRRPAPASIHRREPCPVASRRSCRTIFQSTNLTPLVLLASLLTAAVLGAWHALTPGHGKTLMAAYLVGSRGTSIHAVGLGLSVAASHTLGIVVLALLIVGAQGVLPPDVVVRATPVVAAISIVAIGGWMLVGEIRPATSRRRGAIRGGRRRAASHAAITTRPLTSRRRDHEHEHAATSHDHGHEHGRDAGEHSHGGVRHSHLPPAGATLSWRGLFVLGLAGGLIPSTSALLILLGSIAAGRPAFGLVLVVAFGLGMAAVMTGVGLAMILARGRLDRMPSRSSLGRLAAVAPLVASVAVLGLGAGPHLAAVAGRPVL